MTNNFFCFIREMSSKTMNRRVAVKDSERPSIPNGFVKTNIHGKCMCLWYPSDEQRHWATETLHIEDDDHICWTSPVWKQLINHIFSHYFIEIPINSELVEFPVDKVKILSNDKTFILLTLSSATKLIRLFSETFGFMIKFEMTDDGMECSLPWNDNHNFRIDWPSQNLSARRKYEMMMTQVSCYIADWFKMDIFDEIFLDVADCDGEGYGKDFTLMSPFTFNLPSGALISGICTKHVPMLEATFALRIEPIEKPQKRRSKKLIIEKLIIEKLIIENKTKKIKSKINI